MTEISLQAFKAAFITFGIAGIIALALLLGGFLLGRYIFFKWLDTAFQKRLEAYKIQAQAAAEQQKHELQRILEEKKYQINTRFDRTTRINQLEFEKLPDLWLKLNDAVLKTRELLGLRQYTDVRRLSDEKLKRYLERLEFTENQIERVMESSDRDKTYQTIVDAIDFSKATEAFNDYVIAIRRTSIFIRPDILSRFKDLEDMIKTSLIDYDLSSQGYPTGRQHQNVLKLNDAPGTKLSELQSEVRNRLWGSMVPDVD